MSRSLKPSLFWRFRAARPSCSLLKLNRSPEVLKGFHSFLCRLSVWRWWWWWRGWWGNGEETVEAKSVIRKQMNKIWGSCQEAKKTWTKSRELLHPSADLHAGAPEACFMGLLPSVSPPGTWNAATSTLKHLHLSFCGWLKQLPVTCCDS